MWVLIKWHFCTAASAVMRVFFHVPGFAFHNGVSVKPRDFLEFGSNKKNVSSLINSSFALKMSYNQNSNVLHA